MINKQIRFPNLSNFDRTEVTYTTVDFATGEWDGQSPLVLQDSAGEQIDSLVEPFGARWDDGTVRYAKLLARLTIPGQTTQVHNLVDGQLLAKPRYRTHPAVLAAAGANSPALGIKVNGNWEWTQFTGGVTLLEHNRLRRVYQSRHRMGNFVVDMKYYISSQQQLVKFELAVTGSNPDNTLYSYPFEDIRLLSGAGNLMNIRGMRRRGVEALEPHVDFRLMPMNSYFGNGQKQVWYGEMMPSIDLSDTSQASNGLAALNFPLYGMSTSWKDTNAYASFGIVQPPEGSNPWNHAHGRYHAFNSYMNDNGNPWDSYLLGLAKTAGQTGAQRDFGCIEGGEVLHLGAAELLDAYLFMATEDTKRPGHYYETDASPVRHANHPQWVIWSGQTHWHTSVSPDRLGKTLAGPGDVHHGWFGKDAQHHSSNLLTMAALLTGSYMLQDEADVEMEHYFAGMTLPSEYPGWSTSGKRAPRGFGRNTHAVCNHYLLTGREEIKQHMLNRFHEVCDVQWDGADIAPVRNWGHVLDNRVLNGLVEAWVPWNETLGFVGVVALYNVTHDPVVRDLMIAWGVALVEYGWLATRDGPNLLNAQVGGGVKWNPDGSPLTPAQYLDPALFEHAGGGLQLWGTPAIKVIAENAALFGQTSELATEYLAFQRSNYQPQPHAFAEYGRWEALAIM